MELTHDETVDIKKLSRENEIITGMCNSLNKRIDRLSQTLQEIKAIAETYLTDCQGFKCEAMEEIMQKVTKAEKE